MVIIGEREKARLSITLWLAQRDLTNAYQALEDACKADPEFSNSIDIPASIDGLPDLAREIREFSLRLNRCCKEDADREEAKRTALPDSIQEALNSDDGTYRP